MRKKLIYIVEPDHAIALKLTQKLQDLSYEVLVIDQYPDLTAALIGCSPDAIVINFGVAEEHYPGAGAIMNNRLKGMINCPIIFTAHVNNFETRLNAVRVGGDAYEVLPVDALQLSEKIEFLISRSKLKGYRVLIVDDDEDTSAVYSAILRNAGMSVEVIHRPSEIFNAIESFKPELLLFDVYMPGCNGVELSKIVRQDDLYIDLPIVFLSTEQLSNKQLEIVKAGADDFLCKPIEPKFLVASIASRAERYRSLRRVIKH